MKFIIHLRVYGLAALFLGMAAAASELSDIQAKTDAAIETFLSELKPAERSRGRKMVSEQMNKIRTATTQKLRKETGTRTGIDAKIAEQLRAALGPQKTHLAAQLEKQMKRLFFPTKGSWVTNLQLKDGTVYAGFLQDTDYRTFVMLNTRIDRWTPDGVAHRPQWNSELRIAVDDLSPESAGRFGSREERIRRMNESISENLTAAMEERRRTLGRELRQRLYLEHGYYEAGNEFYTRDEYYVLKHLDDSARIAIDTATQAISTEKKKRMAAQMRLAEQQRKEAAARKAEEQRLAEKKRKADAERCPDCSGTGRLSGNSGGPDRPCGRCNGTGLGMLARMRRDHQNQANQGNGLCTMCNGTGFTTLPGSAQGAYRGGARVLCPSCHGRGQ